MIDQHRVHSVVFRRKNDGGPAEKTPADLRLGELLPQCRPRCLLMRLWQTRKRLVPGRRVGPIPQPALIPRHIAGSTY